MLSVLSYDVNQERTPKVPKTRRWYPDHVHRSVHFEKADCR